MGCQTLDYAHLIGKKWTVVLFEEIFLGKFDGFNSVLKKSGLTPKILSSQLKEMEAAGFIVRGKSKKTVYSITEKGKDFRKIVSEIKGFNAKWDKEDECTDKSCLECGKLDV